MESRSDHHANVTRASLLSRVRDGSDHAAWREFDERYRELILRFCRRRGLQQADADDVAQTVLANLSKSLRGFEYDRSRGRFRDYLYRCVRGVLFERAARPRRDNAALSSRVEAVLEGPDDEAAEFEAEWVAHHYRLAIAAVRETFEARSVEIFDKSVAGASVADLAREHGMSEQAVHKVRQRIKARMEELIAAQIHEEDHPDP